MIDPLLAVHTSLVEPLPHQITAVYGEMLTRQPLRFLQVGQLTVERSLAALREQQANLYPTPILVPQALTSGVASSQHAA